MNKANMQFPGISDQAKAKRDIPLQDYSISEAYVHSI